MTLDDINKIEDFHSKLNMVHENLNDMSIDDIYFFIHTPEVNKFVQFTINKRMNGDNISEIDYQNIMLLIDLIQTVYNYSSKDTGMSDDDFDILEQILEEKEMDIVSSAVKSKRKITHHSYPCLRGTIEKIHALRDEVKANKSRKSLVDWVNKTERLYKENNKGKSLDLWKEEVYIFPKWNGISVIHEFDENNNLIKSLTRGFTALNEAEDVTDVFKPLQDKIKLKELTGIKYGVKTEVIIRDDSFKEYCYNTKEKFSSARSLCNSIVLGETLDRSSILEIKSLRYSTGDDIERLSPEVYSSPFIVCTLKDIKAIELFANTNKKVEGCDCDGVVIYLTNENVQKALGRSRDKNQFEVAYKYNEEIRYSTITDISFSTGPLGKITPIAKIKPVKMKGNVISKISLGSYQRFCDLNLAVGDKVKILYEIIPYLVFDEEDSKCKKSGNNPISGPKKCPECGNNLLFMDTVPRCINNACPSRNKGRILNYLKKIGIKGIDYETITTLYDLDILCNIQDIYSLKNKGKVISSIPGFGKKSFKNMIDEIEEHMTVPVSVMYGALGIPGANKKTFEEIFKKYTPRDINRAIWDLGEEPWYDMLTEIKGIKDKKAKVIMDGIRDNEDVITFLEGVLKIVNDDIGPVRFIAVFHKVRSKEIEELIKKKGGKVEDNITKRTDFLITPHYNENLDYSEDIDYDKNKDTVKPSDKTGFAVTVAESSTIKKAEKYNIPIISIARVKEYIENNYR